MTMTIPPRALIFTSASLNAASPSLSRLEFGSSKKLIKGPCQTDALPLAGGKRRPGGPKLRLIAVRQPHDQFMDTGGLGR